MEGQNSTGKPEQNFSVEGIKGVLPSILPTAIRVITNPVEFYRTMPRTGGYVVPLVFMAAMGVVAAAVGLVIAIVGLGTAGIGMAIVSLILTPILIAIFGFVGAAVVFFIWKLMGSTEGYETAYRSVAYASAIMPITTLLGPIPYLGAVIGLLWTTFLIVIASTEVHGIPSRKAWIVFGAIAAVLTIASLSTEFAGRRMIRSLQGMGRQLESQTGDLQNMTPEQMQKKAEQLLESLKKN